MVANIYPHNSYICTVSKRFKEFIFNQNDMKTFLSILFLAVGSISLFAQTGQMLTASADLNGVQQHALFPTRPANFFIYSHNTNPSGSMDYIGLDDQHNHNHNHSHVVTGVMKHYAYALAPNITPANDQQIVSQYASMIASQGGTIYQNNASGARMEITQNGLNYYILVVPSGGGTQYEITVMEYDPNQQ